MPSFGGKPIKLLAAKVIQKTVKKVHATILNSYVIANLQQLSQYNSNQHQTSFNGDFTSLATSRLGRIIEWKKIGIKII